MSQEQAVLSKKLKGIIKKMKKVQKAIKGTDSPASMHELDTLTRLGEEYAVTVQKIAQLESIQKTQNS